MTLRKRSLGFLSIILLLSQYVYATNNSDTSLVKANYDKAFSYYKNKEYQNAITYFTEVIKENKNHYNAYLYRGVSYEMLGRVELAIADYQEALKLDPQNKLAYRVLVLVRFSTGNYQEFIKIVNTAIELFPSDCFFYYYRGIYFASQNDDESALADLDKCIDHPCKNTAECYILKATIIRNQRKFKETRQILDKFFALYPDNEMGYYERALLNYDQGHYETVVADISKAIEKNPEFYAKGYFWMAESSRLLNKDNEAIKYYDLYLSKGESPENKRGYLGRAASYTNLNKRLEAYQDIETYEKNNGEMTPSYYMIKESLLEKYNDYENLISLYALKEKNNIEDSALYFNEGIAYEHLDQRSKAEDSFKKVVISAKDSYWFKWYSKALLAMYKNDYKEAFLNFDKSIETGGPYSKIVFAKGYIKYEQKDYLGAYKEFGKAIEADSQIIKEHPEIYLFKANIKNKTEGVTESLEDLNKYVSETPNAYQGYFSRGKHYFLIKDYESATKDFLKALSCIQTSEGKEDKEDIYLYLINANTASGKNVEALKHLNDLIKFNSNLSSYYLLRANIKSELERPYKDVLEDINQAITLDGENGYLYFMRGMFRQKYNTNTNLICPDLIKAIKLGVPDEVKLIKSSICK